jgi:hypothetical protein
MPRHTRRRGHFTVPARHAVGGQWNAGNLDKILKDLKAAQGGQDQEAEAADTAAGPEVQDTYGPQARMRSIPATLGANGPASTRK